jgi:phenylacetate-CoA ligase
VRAEVRGEAGEALARRFEQALRARIGVEIRVSLEAPGALRALTGIETRQKPVRLLDRRRG